MLNASRTSAWQCRRHLILSEEFRQESHERQPANPILPFLSTSRFAYPQLGVHEASLQRLLMIEKITRFLWEEIDRNTCSVEMKLQCVNDYEQCQHSQSVNELTFCFPRFVKVMSNPLSRICDSLSLGPVDFYTPTAHGFIGRPESPTGCHLVVFSPLGFDVLGEVWAERINPRNPLVH